MRKVSDDDCAREGERERENARGICVYIDIRRRIRMFILCKGKLKEEEDDDARRFFIRIEN